MQTLREAPSEATPLPARHHSGWQRGHHRVVRPPARPRASLVPQRGQLGSGSSRTRVSHRGSPGTRPWRTAVRRTRRIVACSRRISSGSNPATGRDGCSRACQQISSVSRLPSPAITAWSISVAFSRPRRPRSTSANVRKSMLSASGPARGETLRRRAAQARASCSFDRRSRGRDSERACRRMSDRRRGHPDSRC